MLEILKEYTLTSILTYAVVIAMGVKWVIDYICWAKDKVEVKKKKEIKEYNDEKSFEQFCKETSKQYQEIYELYQMTDAKIEVLSNEINSKINKVEQRLDQLTLSDMHDIKGWIVEKHHFLTKQGWVDDFTMDILEHRYTDYVAEDGNSYVKELMEELRKLPHQKPEE